MTPDISVIIPTHNRRAMLREALASVVAQRGANFEVIVVDDGSIDGTWQDLSGYDLFPQHDNICAVRTARCGPAAARNRGIAMARGRLMPSLIPTICGCPKSSRFTTSIAIFSGSNV